MKTHHINYYPESQKRYFLKNKEKILKQRAEWRKKNLGKVKASSMKSHAKRLLRIPPWLSETQNLQIEAIYAKAARLRYEHNLPVHVDHIVPLQGKNVSGLHVPWNLQIIRAKDNLQKSNFFKQVIKL